MVWLSACAIHGGDAALPGVIDRGSRSIGQPASVRSPWPIRLSKLLNIGTNRWSIKPEVGVSKALGPLTLELDAGVTFYTNNDDFLSGMTLEQDPIYAVQGHLIYNFVAGVWGALDATDYTGGRTTVDGVKGDNLQENTRLGLTVALPVNRYNSIKLYASTGVFAHTGSNFNTGGIVWQFRWGGGL